MSRRVGLLIVGLTLLLGVLLFGATGTAPVSEGPVFTYSSTDAGAGGTLALRRWLSALGYATRGIQGQRFAIPAGVDALFVLGPSEFVSKEDAQTLREWVARGGTAILGSDRTVVDEALYEAFGVALEDRAPRPITGEISPALARPVLRDLSTSTSRALRLIEPAAVLVGDGARAIVAEQRIGMGRVVLISAPDMLVNANLGSAQNDRLVLNLIAPLQPGGIIGFDEYHHGVRTPPDLYGLFTGTAPGRAALLAGALVFLYVALRGRRFGAALPIEDRPARSSLEYIRSFAGLLRRSRATQLAAERLARRYRRRLARTLGLRATSDAEEIVAAVARFDAAKARQFSELFRRLAAPQRDRELLVLAANAEKELLERR